MDQNRQVEDHDVVFDYKGYKYAVGYYNGTMPAILFCVQEDDGKWLQLMVFQHIDETLKQDKNYRFYKSPKELLAKVEDGVNRKLSERHSDNDGDGKIDLPSNIVGKLRKFLLQLETLQVTDTGIKFGEVSDNWLED